MATHCDHVTNMSISSQHVSIVESSHFDARLAPPVQAATAHLRTRSGWLSPEDHGDPDYLTHSPIRSSLRDRGKDWRTRLPMPLDPAAGLTALTDPRRCSTFVLMDEVETLGVARSLGWKVHMRCAKGYRESTRSIRRCVYRKQLDLDTQWPTPDNKSPHLIIRKGFGLRRGVFPRGSQFRIQGVF